MKKVASGILPIIAIDRKNPRPLHKQIYDAYRTSIVDGSLRPGERVPSTRALASELSVSRLPVLDAYAQLLAEGYFETRVGAGTVICASLPDHLKFDDTTGARRAITRSGPRPIARRNTILPPVETSPWLQGWSA